jgi:dipeptidyl aminopeptidase/acylaminoacyl peptidase
MAVSSVPTVAPYGSWVSPITADLIVAGSVGLGSVRVDGDTLYWTEQRPTEAGRTVLVQRHADGTETDVTPAPLNVRTRVHEYGGGAYLVHQGTVYFSNFADQRLYRLATDSDPATRPPQAPVAITPEAATPKANLRYADAVMDATRQRLICVQEDHSAEGEAVNTLVSVRVTGTEPPLCLVAGQDFYADPRLSPDGSALVWLSWNHPQMPWDGTELWLGQLQADGTVGATQKIAGGPEESVVQPQWSPDGRLYFISDRTGWWNLYRWTPEHGVEPLCPKAAEFGFPLWVFGQSHYGFESARRLLCLYSEDGISQLASLDTDTLALTPIALPFTELGGLHTAPGKVYLNAGSATVPNQLIAVDLATETYQVLKHSSSVTIDPRYLSVPQPIAFPTRHGLTAYGFFYPPTNGDCVAPATERPPLMVKSHGGPTAATSTGFNLKIQYWTSRGFAVFDVNYGGSTGYGRAYRDRLKGQWGVVDVEDCVNGAQYLATAGRVDGDRLVINGGSAGGYTTLCALTFYDVFKAGASYYGVSDLEALATDTHKFEARYLDSLIGPYPEQKELYQARSPIHSSDRLNCPIIFFQGAEDQVVPPNQAERMVEVLRAKNLPVAYVLYPGEQHGFRKAENIKRTLEAELAFYSEVFGFALAEAIASPFTNG